MHRIKGTEAPDRYLATLWRARVDVIEMRKVRRIFQLTKGRDAVRGDRLRLRAACQRRYDKPGKRDGAGG